MKKNQVNNLSELQFYVNILEDHHGKKKYTDYELLRKDLLTEFGVKITRQQINELFEPNIIEEQLDLKLIYEKI